MLEDQSLGRGVERGEAGLVQEIVFSGVLSLEKLI